MPNFAPRAISELGAEGSLEIHLEFSENQKAASQTRITLSTPQSKTIEFERDQYLIEDHFQSEAHQSRITLPCRAKKLGFEELKSLRILAKSRLQFWTREFDIPLKRENGELSHPKAHLRRALY